MECMETLLAEMRQGEWRNNRSISVGAARALVDLELTRDL